MDVAEFRQPLGEIIHRELKLAIQLGHALAGERDALRGVNATALDSAIVEKQRCVEQLDGLDTELGRLCATLGFDANRAGMGELLLRADTDGTMTRQWRQLLATLQTCRETNQHNGVLVRLQKRRVTDALGILHGDSAGCTLYGNDGAVDESSGHHVHTEI